MPYILSWYLEKRIIHDRVSGVFRFDDFRVVHQFNMEQLKLGTPPIHIIIDTRRVEKFDFSTADFQQALSTLAGPALGWLILVGTGMMTEFLAPIEAEFLSGNGRMFLTLEEALAFLQQSDITLQKPKVVPGE